MGDRLVTLPDELHGGHGGYTEDLKGYGTLIAFSRQPTSRVGLTQKLRALRFLRALRVSLSSRHFHLRQSRSLCRTNDFLTFEFANQIENRKARTPGDVRVLADLP